MDCANATYCDRVRPGGVAAAPACLVVAAAGNDTAANATCDLSVSGAWVCVLVGYRVGGLPAGVRVGGLGVRVGGKI